MEFGDIISYMASAAGGGGLVGILNWRFSRKKAAESVKTDEIENIRSSISVYQTIISDQNQRINELTAEVKQLRDERRVMEADYQRQLRQMQNQITELYRALGIRTGKRVRDEKTGRYIKEEHENTDR